MRSYPMCHGQLSTNPHKILGLMLMEKWVQHKASSQICCLINYSSYRFNRLWPSKLLVRLPPSPRRRMYIVCNRQLPRLTSRTRERRKTIRVMRIKRLKIMLVRVKIKRKRWSFHVSFVGWPIDSPMPSTCGRPKAISTTTTCFVDERFSTRVKYGWSFCIYEFPMGYSEIPRT